jgi:alpha-amylase/alpha-mannosidase (GH57 family)
MTQVIQYKTWRPRFELWKNWHRERFSEYFGFSSHYRSTNAPYSFSSACFSYQKDKRAKWENLPQRIFSESGSVGKKVIPPFSHSQFEE